MILLLAIPIIAVITFSAIWIGNLEERKFKIIGQVAQYGLNIITVLTVMGILLLVSILVFTYFVMGPVRNPPIVEKQINEQYYFTQNEYYDYGDSSSRLINLYRNTPWFMDYKVGLIAKPGETGNISFKIKPVTGHKVNLLMFSDQTLELDTILVLEGRFLHLGAEYWNKRLKDKNGISSQKKEP